MEQAADAARVSRTTAYRYFPSQRALLAATFPHLEGGSLLGDHPPADVRARVAVFAENMTQSILANEAEMRAMLRLSLEPDVPLHEAALRQGRRTIWVADALAPRTARTIDLATGERAEGPPFVTADGRLDRHGAARMVGRVTRRAGIAKHVSPHAEARIHHRRPGRRRPAAGRAGGRLPRRPAHHHAL